MEHLLVHCSVAWELWTLVLTWFYHCLVFFLGGVAEYSSEIMWHNSSKGEVDVAAHSALHGVDCFGRRENTNILTA